MRSMRMRIQSILTESVASSKDKERRRYTGGSAIIASGGHVTPSFRTGDEQEFQSNVNLVYPEQCLFAGWAGIGSGEAE